MLTRPDLTLSEFMIKAAARAVREFRNRTARNNPHPLIFLGKGKSGTTAIAALFAQATGQSIALDIPALFIDGFRHGWPPCGSPAANHTHRHSSSATRLDRRPAAPRYTRIATPVQTSFVRGGEP
jgi:hypothetical protein